MNQHGLLTWIDSDIDPKVETEATQVSIETVLIDPPHDQEEEGHSLLIKETLPHSITTEDPSLEIELVHS